MSEDIKKHSIPTVSTVLSDGSVVELVYDEKAKKTAFAVWEDGECKIVSHIPHSPNVNLVPYSAHNNLIKNRVILFPRQPEDYGTDVNLYADVQTYIHRYVDVSERFERIATAYVLLTWVYDDFNELPYLRLQGDWGTGKTRFLLTVGSICNKPVFASGASTVSPIFHILDKFRGTLLFDEADFRFSDERAEIVKILNNGNVKGVPVLRTRKTRDGEFNPRAFNVFGPKIVAARGHYNDPALESRFITERTTSYALREDIPISLPPEQEAEALALRNKLLMYRFRNLSKKTFSSQEFSKSVEARLKQIFIPLMSVVDDTDLRDEMHELAETYSQNITIERSVTVEAQVLTSIRAVFETTKDTSIPIGFVTKEFTRRYGKDYDNRITHKWIGTTVRRKLQLNTHKSRGISVIPRDEFPKLEHLYQKYGIVEDEADDVIIEPIQDANDEDQQTIQA